MQHNTAALTTSISYKSNELFKLLNKFMSETDFGGTS